MKLADIAFAAGFSSVRQFNETVGEVFAMTPTALRATAHHHPAPAASTALTLNLPYRKPVRPWDFHLPRRPRHPGDRGRHADVVRPLPAAPPRRCPVHAWSTTPAPRGGRWCSPSAAVDLRDLPALLSRVRRLFDLDADPVAIDNALAADPRLSAAVAAAPGMRMPGALDPQELLIRAMIGQQITVAAARTALTQLSAAGSASLVAGDGLGPDVPHARSRSRRPAGNCCAGRNAE